jgi:uncharacterized integral membrane protein
MRILDNTGRGEHDDKGGGNDMSGQSGRLQAVNPGIDPITSVPGGEPTTAPGIGPGRHAGESPRIGRGDEGNSVVEPAAAGNSQAPIRRTRVSAIWVGLIIAAVLLIGLLIFVGQNSRTVTIHYLGLDGRVPLAVALLASAVCGVLLVAVPGTARIIQLRRALKKNPTGARPATDRGWRP